MAVLNADLDADFASSESEGLGVQHKGKADRMNDELRLS